MVDRALANNHDVGIAVQRLREARALRKQAAGALLPQAGANVSHTRMNLGNLTGGGSFEGAAVGALADDSLEFWSSGIDVSWELDAFGGGRRSARSARARAQAAAELLNGVRQALVAEVTEAYYLVAGLREELALVNAQIALQQSQVDDMRERVAAGASSRLDLARTVSRLEMIREKVPNLGAGITSQRKRLALLLGDRPDALDGQRVAIKALPSTLPMTRTGLPAELVLRRPDLRRHERELAAATEDIGVAVASFYPQFLIGSTGPSAFGAGAGDLFNPSNYVWQFGPRVEWSLFSGGSNRAMLEQADARRKTALLEYEQSVLSAIGEVETELANLEAETRRLGIVRRALDANRDAARRVRENHKAGAAAYVEVLIEEENLRDVEIAEVRIKNQILQVWIRLHKALGGGWER
jgi:NodT family efflux transporter outer membrane factor (OMF) lipoprotein